MHVSTRAVAWELARRLAPGCSLLVLLLTLVLLALVLPVRAQPPPPPTFPTVAESEAALLLGQYAVHEADFEAPGDLLLIWQAAETHSGTLAGRVRWLRRHSRCVVARPPRVVPGRRCRWVRRLGWTGERPRGLPRRWDWEQIRLKWLAYLELALRVVMGEELRRPCDGRPQTWDGWRWSEDRLALGYRLVTCRDPWTGERLLNAGYRWPHWREVLRRRGLSE